METARDVLTALAWRYAFGDLAALALAAGVGADGDADGDADASAGGDANGAPATSTPGADTSEPSADTSATGRHADDDAGPALAAGVPAPLTAAPRVDLARVRALCAFGQGLLDLDAEDFGDHTPDVPPHTGASSPGHVVPQDLVARACASRMPQSPDEISRGALRSLRPAYALLLEVIEARWRRREMAALVAVVHIAAEYFPLLAWEPVLGHAADPARLAGAVTVPGSLFGTRAERACAHSRPEQSAAHRALGVTREPDAGWRAYLDRQHSHVARALGVCVARCRRPCTLPSRFQPQVRELLTERCQMALDFGESALVKLRHAAPVGHGFGVPSPEEVQEAWARTRASLAGKYPLARAAFADGDRPDGGPGVDGRQPADAFPLAGLPALFSAVAGAAIAPDTLLRDVAARLAGAFDPVVPAARRSARDEETAVSRARARPASEAGEPARGPC